jgi:hypothetical protein
LPVPGCIAIHIAPALPSSPALGSGTCQVIVLPSMVASMVPTDSKCACDAAENNPRTSTVSRRCSVIMDRLVPSTVVRGP